MISDFIRTVASLVPAELAPFVAKALGLALILLLVSAEPSAEGVDQDPESFINEVFDQ